MLLKTYWSRHDQLIFNTAAHCLQWMDDCDVLKPISRRKWSGWLRRLKISGSRVGNKIDVLANYAELILDSVLEDPKAEPRFGKRVPRPASAGRGERTTYAPPMSHP